MIRLAQEKGVAAWELILLCILAVVLSAVCAVRLWRQPSSVSNTIFWTVFLFLPFVGPLCFLTFHDSSDRSGSPLADYPVPGIEANFTPRAQTAVALAQAEADRLRHTFVGMEHLLLGLIALGQGVAVHVLRRMRIDLEKLRSDIERVIGTGPDEKLIGNLPFTPRAKMVFTLAMTEARTLRHTYVGTEHLLLGMLREGHGVAAVVLTNAGISIEQTRREIRNELDPDFEAEQ
ncbi:MAG: Clp protease N-terminal domain-containing protein [Verrucomicrobiota bacterium]